MHDDKNELLSKIESQKLQISFLEETLKILVTAIFFIICIL